MDVMVPRPGAPPCKRPCYSVDVGAVNGIVIAPARRSCEIPISMGLISKKTGKEIPLRFVGADNNVPGLFLQKDQIWRFEETEAEKQEWQPEYTKILILDTAEKTFSFVVGEFDYIIPSILRDFSAPVKVVTTPLKEHLIFLMAHDTNPYVRYAAKEKIMLNELKLCVSDGLKLSPALFAAYENVIDYCLKSGDKLDWGFCALMLGIPEYNILIQEFGGGRADPIKLKLALDFMHEELAQKYLEKLLKIYFLATRETRGGRALKNTVLNIVQYVPASSSAMGVAAEQYELAENMTEKVGAMKVLAGPKSSKKVRTEFLQRFWDECHHITNAVNIWLSLRADSPETTLKDMLELSVVDLTNPNKISAVLTGFCNISLIKYHHISGEGYRSIADLVIALNTINPSTACCVVKKLTDFRRYDKERQELMFLELRRIFLETSDLDKGLKELVGKALNKNNK